MKQHFDATHERRYGTCAPDEPAEIVSVRTTVTGLLTPPVLRKLAVGGTLPPDDAFTGTRAVHFGARGFVATPTYARRALLAGNRLDGPALVEEHASTTLVMPDDELEVDGLGNLVIRVGGRR